MQNDLQKLAGQLANGTGPPNFGSMHFYSRIICSRESFLNESIFIFFKSNIGEVLIFVFKKFLSACNQVLSLVSGAGRHSESSLLTILCISQYSTVDLLSRYLL